MFKSLLMTLLISVSTFANTELFTQENADLSKSTRPEAPKLTAPQALSTVSSSEVLLTWANSPTADKYNVQVSTNPMFFEQLVNDSNVSTNEFKLTQLEPGKTYYWRVAAIKSNNDTGTIKSNFTRSSFNTK